MFFVKSETKFLVTIVVIGTLLRFFAIGQHDFWFDEAFSYHIARLPVKDLIAATLSDNNPPIYYLLLHYILKISNNEIVLRLPSLIASIASTVLLYTMLKKLINRKVGLIASALFSLSPLTIYIGTEARLHSLAMLIVILLVIVFFSLKKKPTFINLLVFIVIGIAGLYTQYYISLLFLPFTWIVIRHKILPLNKWFFVLVAMALPLVPWLVASAMTTHNSCSCPSTVLSIPATLVAPAIGGVGEVTMRSFINLPPLILSGFAATSLTTFFLFLRGLVSAKILAPLYLMPLIIISLAGLFLPVFSPKAFAIFSPLYFGIVGLGIAKLGDYRIAATPLVVALGAISVVQITNPFFAGTKLKPIYNIVNQDRSSSVAHTSLLTYYSLNYYSQGNQKHILITQNPLSTETVKFIGGEMQEVDPKSDNLWLVDTEKWTEKDSRKTALQTLFNNYEVKKKDSVNTISVYLLKKK